MNDNVRRAHEPGDVEGNLSEIRDAFVAAVKRAFLFQSEQRTAGASLAIVETKSEHGPRWGRALLSLSLGALVSTLLWIALRPVLLDLPPDYITFPRFETRDQRVFAYVVFGAGALLASLSTPSNRQFIGATTAALTYLAVASYVQGLSVNPDYWKLSERGYLYRTLELLVVGAAVGAAVAIGHHAVTRLIRSRR